MLLSLIASLFLVLRTTVFVNKAATGNTSSVALENSYLFASPLQAKADGKEQVRITVYLLDGRGLGIPNLEVKLDTPKTVSVNKIQSLSDDSGKTVFDLSSVVANNFFVTATIGNRELPQKVKVVFY